MKERPTLRGRGNSWTVFVPGDGIGLGYSGKTPGEAMAAALLAGGLDPQYCRTCAGIGASPNWNGKPPLLPCDACHGTKAAVR
jgi:hypothetical protein